MISHTYPWTGIADGGKLGSAYRAPLAERPRVSVGGRSGLVFLHFREQGRPQGASFSAGDLSRCCRRPKLSRNYRLPLVQVCGARRQRRQADGGDELADGYVRGVFRGAREPRNAVRFIALTPVRSGRPDHPARNPHRTRPHHRKRGVCGAGEEFSDLGAHPLRRPPGDAARARPPPGHQTAPTGRPRRAAPGMTGRRLSPLEPAARAIGPEAARSAGHIPVLLDAVLAALAPHDDAVYVDGPFGGGGYREALLNAAYCRVFGIDRDPEAVRRGRDLAQRYGERLRILEGRFGDMAQLLASVNTG